MTPALHDMPVTRATWDPMRRAWLVDLPGGVTLPARDQFEAEMLVLRHAPGSALAFVRDVLRGGADAQATPPAPGTGSTSEHITHTVGD